MGFIGKIFKKIGSAVGGIVKGVVKFAKSPLGSLLLQVGLTALTGGAGGIIAKGLSLLGGAGKIGGLLSTFSGVASKFLGPVASFVSKSGLGTIANFLGKTGNASDLLSMATDIFKSRQSQPATDPTTNDIVRQNLMKLFAYQQAQQVAA